MHCVVVGQRAEELEGQLKDKDCELLKRDRVITDLRVRLPASSDRDAIFDKVASQSAKSPRDEDYESSQAVRVATSTVSSLQVAAVAYTLSSGHKIVSFHVTEVSYLVSSRHFIKLL